jgi:hypothetical protein
VQVYVVVTVSVASVPVVVTDVLMTVAVEVVTTVDVVEETRV